jgi:hypothetical protein
LPHRPLADGSLQAYDVPDAAAGRAAEPAERVQRVADTAASIDLRVGEIARPAAARQSHQRHAADDVEPGDGELRLKVPRCIVHVLGDRAGAQHDAEGIDGAVVDDGTAVRVGLVHRLQDVVLPTDDRQTGDDLGCGLALAPRHHVVSRRP